MRIQSLMTARRMWTVAAMFVALIALRPMPASAQRSTFPQKPQDDNRAIGERYHIEGGISFWNPTVAGLVSSEQFGYVGSNIDFVTDLGYIQTRFRELKLILRPAKKHRFRIQYTPIDYLGDTSFKRNIVFNGVVFPLAVPVQSELGWKVLRLGYEYDFIYLPRGFVGVLFDARYTKFTASLSSPIPCSSSSNEPCKQFMLARAPLPAIGIVGRGYVTREVALNFELSGLKLPNVDPKYAANYYDWNISGTVNLTNNVGFDIGWRRITTFLAIDKDMGDVKFQGMWFGASLRY
jgi:hypothetical protein